METPLRLMEQRLQTSVRELIKRNATSKKSSMIHKIEHKGKGLECIPQFIQMSFLQRLFRRTPLPVTAPVPIPAYPAHMGAGCVFTDGKHILCGYQPHKKRAGITGIGGHKEGEETYLQTAYRETIEELFHVTNTQIPIGLLDKLIRTMRPKKIKMKKGYVLVTFDFADLVQFLKVCQKGGIRSPLYTKMPKTLLETIQNRGYDPKAEISALCLLPVVYHDGKAKDFVNPNFIQDLRDMT